METPDETASISVISSWNERAPELQVETWVRAIFIAVIIVAIYFMFLGAPMVALVSGFVVANLVVALAVWQGVALRDRDVLASFGFALICVTLILVTVSVYKGVMPGFPTFYDLRWMQIVLVVSAVLIGAGLRSWWWVVILTTSSTTALLGLEFWQTFDVGRIQRMQNWRSLAPAHKHVGFMSSHPTINEFEFHDIAALTLAAAGVIALAAAAGTAVGIVIAPRSGSRQFATWSYFVVVGLAGYSVRDVDFFVPGSVLVVLASSFVCGIIVRTRWSLALVPLAALAGGLAYHGLMIADIGVFQYWSELTCRSREFLGPVNCSIDDESLVIKITAMLAMISVALGRLARFFGEILLDMFRG
jgi:hypothetical protein